MHEVARHLSLQHRRLGGDVVHEATLLACSLRTTDRGSACVELVCVFEALSLLRELALSLLRERWMLVQSQPSLSLSLSQAQVHRATLVATVPAEAKRTGHHRCSAALPRVLLDERRAYRTADVAAG